MNDESAPRLSGWQTERLPTHARTVLVRLDDPKMPVWLAYYDSKKWRSLNRGELHGVTGWCELDEVALALDRFSDMANSQ